MASLWEQCVRVNSEVPAGSTVRFTTYCGKEVEAVTEGPAYAIADRIAVPLAGGTSVLVDGFYKVAA